MEYSRFVRERRPGWDLFQAELEAARKSPKRVSHEDLETLALRYRRLLGDYALARARFSGTSAARRLSHLSLVGTRWLFRDPLTVGGALRDLLQLWTRRFPRAFRHHLPEVGLAVALFLGTGLMAVAVTGVEPRFGRLFLPEVAIQGLARGEIWTDALRESPGQLASAFIAGNNLKVAFMAWAGGLLAGFGTTWVLVVNGAMLGSVIGITAHYTMAPRLFDFISAHGPLEISLILVAAGAGFTLARGLIQATDRPRWQEVQRAARDSFVLVVGCAPWFLVLGFVEGFISPLAEVSMATKAALGVGLLLVFLLGALRPGFPPPKAKES